MTRLNNGITEVALGVLVAPDRGAEGADADGTPAGAPAALDAADRGAAPGAAAEAAMPSQWRLLIARRPADSVFAGYWELPGGKREPGESLEQCLMREFREELALSVTVTDALPAVDHTYDHGRVRLCPFFCRQRAADQAPQALAVAEWRWIRPDELAGYTFPPANAPLIRHIEHALRLGPADQSPPPDASARPSSEPFREGTGAG